MIYKHAHTHLHTRTKLYVFAFVIDYNFKVRNFLESTLEPSLKIYKKMFVRDSLTTTSIWGKTYIYQSRALNPLCYETPELRLTEYFQLFVHLLNVTRNAMLHAILTTLFELMPKCIRYVVALFTHNKRRSTPWRDAYQM